MAGRCPSRAAYWNTPVAYQTLPLVCMSTPYRDQAVLAAPQCGGELRQRFTRSMATSAMLAVLIHDWATISKLPGNELEWNIEFDWAWTVDWRSACSIKVGSATPAVHAGRS